MMYKIFLLPFRLLYTEVTNTYRVFVFYGSENFCSSWRVRKLCVVFFCIEFYLYNHFIVILMNCLSFQRTPGTLHGDCIAIVC